MAQLPTILQGKRIAFIGLGVESLALIQLANREEARSITVSDLHSQAEMAALLEKIADTTVPIEMFAGSNDPAAWADADVIFVSPGISPGFEIQLPGIAEAIARNAIISNHTQMVFERSPAPIVGITGSAGKTTTTTVVAAMLQRDGKGITYLGGNMGIPLINEVPNMYPDDVVVLEISDVQLARLHASPHIGVITNITPDHLDRYGTFERYVQAKRQMVRDMTPADIAILNYDSDVTRESAGETSGRVFYFSRAQSVPIGADCSDGFYTLHMPDQPAIRLCPVAETALPGNHNVENMLAASLAAYMAGAAPEVIAETIRTFQGVANRLEFVAEKRGVRYYNDSIATSPSRMQAALRSFDAPILLIAGGKDKDLPWDEVAREIVQRVRIVAVLGVSAPKIIAALEQAREELPAERQMLKRIRPVASIEEAVASLADAAQPGDIVLLSPGCTSHDMFHGYVERARHFIDAVQAVKS